MDSAAPIGDGYWQRTEAGNQVAEIITKGHEDLSGQIASNIMSGQPDDHASLRAAAERAYGLLWMYLGTDKLPHEARRYLVEQIGSEGQRRGIAYAIAKHGEPDISWQKE